MSLRQKTIKGVFWSAVQNWGSNLILTAVLLVLAHLLPAEAFGLVALASAVVLLMEILLKQGFGQALVQKAELEPEHLDTAFWTSVSIAVVLTLAGVAAADVVATLFGEPELAPIVRWLSSSFLIGAFGHTQQALLRRRLAFKSLAIRSLVAAVGGGIVGIGMALWGCGVWSLVGQFLTSRFVGSVALWAAIDWRPRFTFSGRHLRELWSFGVYAMGINLLGFFSHRTDTLLIGYFLGTELLGYYFLAFRLLSAMTQVFAQTVSAVALPTFSRLQHDSDQTRHAFCTATQMTGLIAFPAFVGLAVLAPEFVPVLFGTQWGPSVPVVQILALFGILQAVFQLAGPIILARGKASWRFGLGCLDAVTQVIVVAVAVQWGIVAVAVACVIRIALTSPASLAVVHKLIRLDFADYLRRCATPVAASLVMGATVLGAKWLLAGRMSESVLLAACILIGVCVYSLLVVLFARPLAGRTWELLRLGIVPQNNEG